MVLLSHPTGNANVRQTALALARADLLQEFWTSLYWDTKSPLHARLPASLQSELGRRAFPDELKPFIRTSAFHEIGRQMSLRLNLKGLVAGEKAPFNIEAVLCGLDRRVARRLSKGETPDAVYAYDHGALDTFRVAKQRGIKCIYEHPIGYWREIKQLQKEESERTPEWACTLGSLGRSDDQRVRKEEELALADLIIVASSFSKSSLSKAPVLGGPVKIVPYGAPEVLETTGVIKKGANDKLKIMFVGGLTQAKGLGYLLNALEPLEEYVELTLIGNRAHPDMPTDAMLAKWNWLGSVPHDQVLNLMGEHHVLVCPTLHEGFGLVILEALSRGLPVIATENCGAPDVMQNGREGFIVPIRSAEKITESLEYLIRNPDRLSEMSEAALKTARECSWNVYAKNILQAMDL